ncbi:hypothetical protein BDV12DRAFT_33294 [Aspergillus spectabilis]
MSRQPKLRPKTHIAGFPDAIYDLSSVSTLSQLESRMALGEEKPDQRVFRVKRKHVLKACDRCRVKKTKCDGKQPCNRCSSYNHPCLFRERKATQTKVYSRGFVEMLEAHHSLVVKALQRLYKLCANNEGFPGEPLVEASDGYPLTHAILDRLGLIQQAEASSKAVEEDSEDLQYLRVLSSSTDCTATADPSPEPATPPEPSLNTASPVQVSQRSHAPLKWEIQSVQPEPFHGYSQAEFRGMTLPRPILDPAAFSNETKCAATDPSPVAGLAHTYLYYADSSCNPEATENRLQPIVTTAPTALPAVTAAGLPAHMVEGYSIHLPDHQPVYSALNTAWTYHCE